MPFSSSALIITSVVAPLAAMRPTRKPNGEELEMTPAAVSPAIVAAVSGRLFAETRLPILVMVLLPKRFHCTPNSRPAVREISMKRTSSNTCCGDITETVLMISGPNCRAIVTALSSVAASATSPDSMMRPLTLEAWIREPGKRRSSSLLSRVMS